MSSEFFKRNPNSKPMPSTLPSPVAPLQSTHANDEQILVIKREVLEELGYFTGISFDTAKFAGEILRRCEYAWRKPAENDVRFKQIVNYAVLVCGDKICRYRRSAKTEEQRLAAKYSIGLGGHMNVQDLRRAERTNPSWDGSYCEAVRREVMDEEVRTSSLWTQSVVAMINDDSDIVGLHHIGIVHLFELTEPDIHAREKVIEELGFFDTATVLAERDKLESWSRICLDNLEQIRRHET